MIAEAQPPAETVQGLATAELLEAIKTLFMLAGGVDRTHERRITKHAYWLTGVLDHCTHHLTTGSLQLATEVIYRKAEDPGGMPWRPDANSLGGGRSAC